MAGQNLKPKINSTDKDMPVGNQTKVANPPTGSIVKPIFAVAK